VMDEIGFGESMRLCVNPCPLWDTTLSEQIFLNLGNQVVQPSTFT
jgi:hypothetical protein